ncbi:mechanosensitive ion channel family protein [Pedobacter endophyticus]|uniref:Mechanosensitive ion channel family protein n=1 Tax=Pedobacter endophyticus TaxID=2789740 RepID=A0A7S9PYM4_9SPHI|nr:mechanosensitive ion channel family protein [Pedobacter endophyticus]QPH39603.1 mechanosensitive ion channel family protein [Pedobacter endophyticus]
MIKIFAAFFFLSLSASITCLAQKDSTASRQDSLIDKKLDNSLDGVRQLAAERLSDSLKRSELERKFSDLGTDDKAQKAALMKELNQLKQRDSVHLARQLHQIDSLRAIVKGMPVVFDADTIFYIFAKFGSFSASDRAHAITERLERISETPGFSTDSLKLSPGEQAIDLLYGNNLLLSITEQDAMWARKDRNSYAAEIKRKISASLNKFKEENSWQVLLKEILLTLLVISVVIGLIYLINKLFKKLKSKILSTDNKLGKGIKIRNYELLDSERQQGALNILIRTIRYIVILLVIYLAIPVLFGIFPFTRDLSVNLINYILSPLRKIGVSIWNYIPNLMTILVLLLVFRYVIRLVRFLKTEIERGKLTIPGFYKDWANPTYQIIRVLILAFMLIVIFPYLPGSDSGVFKGVSVFVGVLFTFGSAGALGNLVAGLVLTYMRAFRIGDRVRIGDVTGDIIEKTLLVTRVRTIQNEVVSIPNSTVMNNHTINFSIEAAEKGLIVNTTVTIGYDVPWRQVHQLLIDAALATELIEAEPAPYVLQTSLDDYYVSYRLNAHTKSPNRQAVIYSGLHANIQDEFNKAGVEIMSPHYKALRDGNATTIPSAYLPKDYDAPKFRTESSATRQKTPSATKESN